MGGKATPIEDTLLRVTNVTTWAQCFMAYAAILLSDKLIEVMESDTIVPEIVHAARLGLTPALFTE